MLLIRCYLNLDQHRLKPAKQRLLGELMNSSVAAVLQAELYSSINETQKFAVGLILSAAFFCKLSDLAPIK